MSVRWDNIPYPPHHSLALTFSQLRSAEEQMVLRMSVMQNKIYGQVD